MELKLKKTLYPIDVVMRAAFVFTDDGYIYLDEDEENIIVSIEPKANCSMPSLEGEFKNELLAQILRKSVSDRTRGIREVIYQRAMSSSMILSEGASYNQGEPKEDYDLELILKDWFEGE